MIYNPREDSYLLSEVLKKKVKKTKIKKVLDMGSGSGIQAQTLIDLGIPAEKITLVDIDKESINFLKKKFSLSKIIKSNLFSNLKGRFDLVVFNPPYLAENKHDKEKDTSGGKKGDEVILKFLRQLKNHLTNKGKTLLLTSSLTPMNQLNKSFKKYKVKLLAKKKLFFEELYVWELSLK